MSRGARGPWIFASRLSQELQSTGLKFDENSINRLSIIEGKPQEDKYNILRLDGLYFMKGGRNRSIFEAYKSYDHIVFQGEFCRQQYEAFTEVKKTHSIIRNGVGDEFFQKQTDLIKTDRPVVVACSRWRRHKRLEEIIEAFSSPELQNIELWVINGKTFKGEVTDNIKLIGHQPPTSLPKILQSATAMIHLSWLDWCPNSVVEGLASGLPVLCSHNGGTKELVKDDGIVIQLEEDYAIGTPLQLYQPPKVDVNIIIQGVKELIEMPKLKDREDLKIRNVALKYKEIFK